MTTPEETAANTAPATPRTTADEPEALKKLREKREERLASRRSGNLRLRNALNAIFILMALVAMAGVTAAALRGASLTPWYSTALAAVLVKMAEVALRLPAMKK